jgi:RimJ/RimL family protein N-acetyltransferase
MLEAPSLDEIRKFVGDNVASGGPQFVAVAQGRVVGWCDVMPYKRPTLSHTGELGMGVVRDFRRQGIGRALARDTIAAAWKFGLLRISLSVREGNAAALALYQELGFRHEGTLVKGVRCDGRFEDIHIMGLLKEDAI